MSTTVFRAMCLVASCILPPNVALGGSLTTLYRFRGRTDPSRVNTPLTYHAGVLYGTSANGGRRDVGTIFRLDLATKVETVLFDFGRRHDGQNPSSGLQPYHGAFYGTTLQGGHDGAYGTLFRFDPAAGRVETVYTFGPSGARLPCCGLLSLNGTLLGTSDGGGEFLHGSVFSIHLDKPVQTVLHSFKHGGEEYASPGGPLLSYGNHVYGFTYSGGSERKGNVFRMNVQDGKFTLLHDFTGAPDGGGPDGGLVVKDDVAYGVTSLGGVSDDGTVYSLDLRTGTLKILHSFSVTDGAAPYGKLIWRDGALYGTTSGGGRYDAGTIFKMDPVTGATNVLHSFTGGSDDGGIPGALTYYNGVFYGATLLGSRDHLGTVFMFVP
jgi:uncharacterized repeat protein (TIGR03803 family)